MTKNVIIIILAGLLIFVIYISRQQSAEYDAEISHFERQITVLNNETTKHLTNVVKLENKLETAEKKASKSKGEVTDLKAKLKEAPDTLTIVQLQTEIIEKQDTVIVEQTEALDACKQINFEKDLIINLKDDIIIHKDSIIGVYKGKEKRSIYQKWGERAIFTGLILLLLLK